MHAPISRNMKLNRNTPNKSQYLAVQEIYVSNSFSRAIHKFSYRRLNLTQGGGGDKYNNSMINVTISIKK